MDASFKVHWEGAYLVLVCIQYGCIPATEAALADSCCNGTPTDRRHMLTVATVMKTAAATMLLVTVGGGRRPALAHRRLVHARLR